MLAICKLRVTLTAQAEEEEQFGPLLVGTLEQHGIAANDVKKLMVGFNKRMPWFLVSGSKQCSGCGILHCRVCCLCSKEEADGDQGKDGFQLVVLKVSSILKML